MKSPVETAGIMAEIKPYFFNPCETVRSQRKTMFTRVKMSAEEEINRSMHASVVRSRTEKGNKRKNVYDARSIEEAVNILVNTTFVFSRC